VTRGRIVNDPIHSDDQNIVSLPSAGEVRRALDRLQSLKDGDLGVVDITACGRRAIPALRALLLEGRSSGIYQPRCRAIEALSALGAHDVLIEFLSSPREISDPVNRTGEDAVVNAAARALVGLDNERVFPLLTRLAEMRPLAGVVEAIGSFPRAESVPHLVRALAEDHTRAVAEEALLQLGSSVRPALVDLAARPQPSAEAETASSVRIRRSALRLLARIGAPPRQFAGLIYDADPEIAAEACAALLGSDDSGERMQAVARLVDLLPQLPWFGVSDAERCLVEHFEDAREIVAARLRQESPDPLDTSPAAQRYRSLLRVVRRARAALP
jgi:HEAT repeat protein